MRRRRFLALAGGVGIATPGLLGVNASRSPERTGSAASRPGEPVGEHDLFIENHTDRTEEAWIRIEREDGAVLVDGRYELPDGRGIRFDDVGEWDEVYTVGVSLVGGSEGEWTWVVDECPPPFRGSRNAAVRYGAGAGSDPSSFDFVIDECDALMAGKIATGDAETFRVND